MKDAFARLAAVANGGATRWESELHQDLGLIARALASRPALDPDDLPNVCVLNRRHGYLLLKQTTRSPLLRGPTRRIISSPELGRPER